MLNDTCVISLPPSLVTALGGESGLRDLEVELNARHTTVREDTPIGASDVSLVRDTSSGVSEDDIVRQWEHLVMKVSGKFYKQCQILRFDRDELLNVGRVGVLKAWRNFDEKRGVDFKTYCYTSVRCAMSEALRESLRGTGTNRTRTWFVMARYSLDDTVPGASEDENITFKDVLVDRQAHEDFDRVIHDEDAEDQRSLELLAERLYWREIVVMLLRARGWRFKDIGKKLNISESRAFQLLQEVLAVANGTSGRPRMNGHLERARSFVAKISDDGVKLSGE